MADEERHQGDTVIPVVEEVASVRKRTRTTGRVRVSTVTEVVEDDVSAPLDTHTVEVTRVPIGRDLDPGEAVPGPREEGETTILPVLEEVLIVTKGLRLVEEVHIRRTTQVEDVHVAVTRRRQVANIEHDDVSAIDSNPRTE